MNPYDPDLPRVAKPHQKTRYMKDGQPGSHCRIPGVNFNGVAGCCYTDWMTCCICIGGEPLVLRRDSLGLMNVVVA